MKKYDEMSKIKDELISKDLTQLLKTMLIVILLCGICGYFGYTYSIENNLDAIHGIIIGCLYPLGIIILKALYMDGFFAFVIYSAIFAAVFETIPLIVGIVILFVVVLICAVAFINIETKDRTEEIQRIYGYKGNTFKASNTANNTPIYEVQADIVSDDETNDNDLNSSLDDDFLNDNLEDVFLESEEEEYECEVCFKKISYEEYEDYDCMCEDCYLDMHTDEKGNFHDENF